MRKERINKVLRVPTIVGRYSSTRVDEGTKFWIQLEIKMKAHTLRSEWGGGRRARYVTPGLSCYWEGGRECSGRTVNGMEKFVEEEQKENSSSFSLLVRVCFPSFSERRGESKKMCIDFFVGCLSVVSRCFQHKKTIERFHTFCIINVKYIQGEILFQQQQCSKNNLLEVLHKSWSLLFVDIMKLIYFWTGMMSSCGRTFHYELTRCLSCSRRYAVTHDNNDYLYWQSIIWTVTKHNIPLKWKECVCNSNIQPAIKMNARTKAGRLSGLEVTLEHATTTTATTTIVGP